jgi:hypothetical protein
VGILPLPLPLILSLSKHPPTVLDAAKGIVVRHGSAPWREGKTDHVADFGGVGKLAALSARIDNIPI